MAHTHTGSNGGRGGAMVVLTASVRLFHVSECCLSSLNQWNKMFYWTVLYCIALFAQIRRTSKTSNKEVGEKTPHRTVPSCPFKTLQLKINDQTVFVADLSSRQTQLGQAVTKPGTPTHVRECTPSARVTDWRHLRLEVEAGCTKILEKRGGSNTSLWIW